MNKIVVNDAFLDSLIYMFGGDDDNKYEYYKALNMKTEEDYKKIIKNEITVYFNNQHNQIKDKIKKALAYYLSKTGYDFERVFYSCLPSFDIPSSENGKLFFKWIWEELFGSENYLVTNLGDYEEISDWQEIGRMNEIIKEYGEYTEENILKNYKMKNGEWVRLKK